MKNNFASGSFRDPAGFIFFSKGIAYRQVNNSYKEDWDLFIKSGLYKDLIKNRLIIKHKELKLKTKDPLCYKILQPDQIPFVSYPYEWSFSQIKDAALTTLEILKMALLHGMVLKDASAYNIQFIGGKLILIDTLSFTKYIEGEPWIAYRQFCQHFLAPLALISFKDYRLNLLTKSYIDGIPLDLVSSLLPMNSRFNFSLFTHIFMHAKSQKLFAKRAVLRRKVSRFGIESIILSLESLVRNLKWENEISEWGDYYSQTNYSQHSFNNKKEIVSRMLAKTKQNIIWDIGANTGVFSEIASQNAKQVISFDNDPATIEKNYLRVKRKEFKNILPLVIDLTSPSPSLGWQNEERMSLLERGPADIALALALIHHLAISNNLPFRKIASFFAKISNNLIIEFVPKSDSQAQRLLATREDIFNQYDEENFEKSFLEFFTILERHPIKSSKRVIYKMAKN